MKMYVKVFIALFLFSCLLTAGLKDAKGSLFIIGGGERVHEMKKFVDLAGGVDSRIILIPMASSEPIPDVNEELVRMKKIGCKNIDFIYCDRKGADLDSNIAKLKNTTGVFFLGGDQVRLTGALSGSKLFEGIKSIYEKGGVLGGTSAGAAVMSEIMITGEELINKDTSRNFYTIQKGNVQTVQGFGFVTKAIIDQHFVIRKRLNRLISVVLEHPNLIGVGIDESTGIIVKADDTFEVFGGRTVVIIDATQAENISTNEEGLLSAQSMKLNILHSGEKYDLNKKQIIK
jgi:cyanophycinase